SLAKRGPVLIHAITKKGRGYQPAESDPGKLHAVKAAKADGPAKARRVKAPTYSQVFGDALIRLAEGRDDIVAITAAMGPGTGLSGFGERFPDRFFDVGIAEQHAVTLAAGLACGGFRPVAAIYSTFLQRAYDQVIHDVALQNLPVLFAIDRAGFAGDDGATHHGAFDIAYLRTVPNFVLMAPKDEAELCRMLATGLAYPGPAAVRYPRGEGLGVALPQRFEPLPIGRGEVVRAGEDLTLFAYGAMVQPALDAAERLSLAGIEARVVNARFAKPLDEALLLECARETGALLTLEEGSLAGGFGAAVLECLAAANAQVSVTRLGLPDRFVDHGGVDALCAEAGLSVDDIVDSARRLLAQSKSDVGPKRSPFRIRRAVGR
ncbi:MAG TPA: transketolase C-terminal domain-containing protein, partial [Limnochordia bacterium]|nr:transketolase C-terminal domain-containing protein [Limnochordia bacterium]